MDEGVPIIIEASLRCFLQRMENAPGADDMAQWMEKFMEAEVRPHEVGKLLERFATPEKAVLRFLDFIEAQGFVRV
jgi:hypothetical protein